MNPMIVSLLELLKYTVPSLIVLLASYLIVQKFLVSELQRKQTALLQDTQNITVPLRLQAYERLTLFIERITPRQLIPRIYNPEMNVAVLRQLLLNAINGEFEHNLSQQIYVSRQVWETVKNVREQELAMVNQIASQMDPEAPARDLQARIIDYTTGTEGELPTTIALQIISDEAKRVLSFGAL